MSQCYNCGKEFTLRKEEAKCDNCNQVVNFPCHNCKDWFSIEGIKECSACGFFVCPNCGVCGYTCPKDTWVLEIRKILAPEINHITVPNLDEKMKKVLDYIEDIKLSKEKRCCPHGVPISYAKGRIKSCIVRTRGYRIKNELDLEKFKERIEMILNQPIGKILTINQSREEGSYGQEYRDVFNLCLCEGKLKKKKIEKEINDKTIEYEVYERCENGQCKMLDLKNLVVKECPNKTCKIKTYPRKETHCTLPECRYKKGKKKGELRELNLKISNKDICQLNRGEFKKDGEGKPVGNNREAN